MKPIELPKDTEKRLIESIQRYVDDNLDQDIGNLQASLLLDFCVREIGPSIYNQAILDAQAHVQDRVADLDSSLYRPEFGYFRD